jgi:hypothetical protein
MGIGMQKDFFMAHSATVEVAEAVYGRMTGWSLNNGLESVRKEVVMASFEALLLYLPE